jgi:ATP-dependent Clp protease ATP-binding subunit ClpC
MCAELNARAQRIMALAEQAARTNNHDYVGTEHILLGLLDEGEGIATKTLEALGLSLEVVRQEVQRAVSQGSYPPSGRLPLTRQAASALEFSRQEAARLGRKRVGTEHILLGLLMEGNGVAAQVLLRLGASLVLVRQQVSQFQHGRQGVKPPVPPGPAALKHQPRTGPAPASETLPVLERFGSNLTKRAGEGELYPVVGRDDEIGELVQALSPDSVSCPVLIGDITGRTAVLAGLAQRIVTGEVPQVLRGSRLFYCDIAGIMAAVREDGVGEAYVRDRVTELLASILKEKRSADGIILVLDDLFTMAADPVLKPVLTGGTRGIIGAASPDDFRTYIGQGDALTGPLRQIHVGEHTTAYAIGKLKIALRASAQDIARPARA